MSSPVSPPQPTTRALRRASWPGADMRVGDVERAEIADHLARHLQRRAARRGRVQRAARPGHARQNDGRPIRAAVRPARRASRRRQEGGRRHQRKMLKVQLERERLALKHDQRTHRRAERELRWRTLRWVPLLIALHRGRNCHRAHTHALDRRLARDRFRSRSCGCGATRATRRASGRLEAHGIRGCRWPPSTP